MANQFNLRLSDAEAFELLKRMRDGVTHRKTRAIYERLSGAYMDRLRTPARSNLNFAVAATIANPEVMRMIVHALSVLTGKPESQILPTTKLADLKLTPTKKEQLRKSINRFLVDKGSTKFITSAELAACKTVQDLYDLTIKKL